MLRAGLSLPICVSDPKACGIYASKSVLSESAMPLLEHNIRTNAHLFSSANTSPRAVVLDWDDERLPTEVTDVEGRFDMIVWVFRISTTK